MTEHIKIRVKNGDIMIIDKKVAEKSKLLNELVKELADEEDDIPVFEFIDRDTMNLVITFMEYHSKNPMTEIKKPMKSNDLNECGVSKWDVEFIDVDDKILIQLATASDMFDIVELFELTSIKIASKMHGKQLNELVNEFSLKVDDKDITKLNKTNCWYEGD
jgi:S-phase kinase-associated protein 1